MLNKIKVIDKLEGAHKSAYLCQGQLSFKICYHVRNNWIAYGRYTIYPE